MSTYREVEPPSGLQHLVHCVWTYEAHEAEPVHYIVPDARPEFIVHLAQPYRETQSGLRQPPIVFAGQLTAPLALASDEGAAMIGVRFRPDGARAFLGMPVYAATDKRLDLIQVHGHACSDLNAVLRGRSPCARTRELVCAYVHDRVGHSVPDPLVRAAVEACQGGDEADSADTVPIEQGVCARQFQRRFKAQTGISLRTYRSIRRFRSVFDRLTRQGQETWVQHALATGYFDQSHLARDFQRFLGCSARQWIEQSQGLAKALGEVAS